MPSYFKMATRYTPAQVAEVEQRMADPTLNPRDIKMELAREIVSIFHSVEAAQYAEQDFITKFQKGEIPDNIAEVAVKARNIVDIVVEVNFAKSKGDAKRLIEGGGVTVDGRKVADWKENLELSQPVVLKVGKRNFARVSGA